MKEVWRPRLPFVIASMAIGMAIGLGFTAAAWFASRRRRSMAAQLRRALRRGGLHVVYQPIVDVHSGAMTSCEALVRWTDENRNPVRPDVFVCVAEDEGFICDVTMYVLDRVTTEMGELLKEHPRMRVSVNLSAHDLADDLFLARLDALLEKKNISPRNLGFELTERSTTEKAVAVSMIRSLRSRGHTVYIDDFGTGYSSLAYLHELQVDVLKVDRAFTNTIGTDSIASTIVPQILSMAKTLKLKVVMEGIERAAQAEFLHTHTGDVQGQGWLYGKPVPMEDLRRSLRGS